MRRELTWSGLTAMIVVGVLCWGCECSDGKERPGAETKQVEPPPTKPVPKGFRPKARGSATEIEQVEAFAAKTVSTSGEVKARVRKTEKLARPADGTLLYGGASIETGADGSAVVTIREVGQLTLGPNSRLVVPDKARCGATLVYGTGELQGPRRVPKSNRCYLHTTSATIWAPRAKVALAAAATGETKLGAGGKRAHYVDQRGFSFADAHRVNGLLPQHGLRQGGRVGAARDDKRFWVQLPRNPCRLVHLPGHGHHGRDTDQVKALL